MVCKVMLTGHEIMMKFKSYKKCKLDKWSESISLLFSDLIHASKFFNVRMNYMFTRCSVQKALSLLIIKNRVLALECLQGYMYRQQNWHLHDISLLYKYSFKFKTYN